MTTTTSDASLDRKIVYDKTNEADSNFSIQIIGTSMINSNMNTYNTNCRNTLSTYINNVDCPITAKQ
jgi:hypothetical protein